MLRQREFDVRVTRRRGHGDDVVSAILRDYGERNGGEVIDFLSPSSVIRAHAQ